MIGQQSVTTAEQARGLPDRAHHQHHQEKPEDGCQACEEVADSIPEDSPPRDLHGQSVLLLRVERDEHLDRGVDARSVRRDPRPQNSDGAGAVASVQVVQEGGYAGFQNVRGLLDLEVVLALGRR